MTTPFEDYQGFESGREAHELACILRMQDSGWPTPAVCQILKMTTGQYVQERSSAMGDEAEAKRTGAVIWKGKVK